MSSGDAPRQRLIINMPLAPGKAPVPALEQMNSEIFTMTYGSLIRQLIADFEDLEEVNKQLDTMWVPGGPPCMRVHDPVSVPMQPACASAHCTSQHGTGACRGYNIGIRLVDEFLAKARMGKCSSFRETAEVIAKQAFIMFINVQCTVTNWSQDARECSLVGRAGSWGNCTAISYYCKGADCRACLWTTWCSELLLMRLVSSCQVFTDNPLTEFVELPEEYRELKYCNILCGVIRGSLEMASSNHRIRLSLFVSLPTCIVPFQVNMDVECRIVQDMLKGDDCYELRLKLKVRPTLWVLNRREPMA